MNKYNGNFRIDRCVDEFISGWSGHPVCSKRYHFIIKADGNSIGGYNKPCIRCGDILHFSELRY